MPLPKIQGDTKSLRLTTMPAEEGEAIVTLTTNDRGIHVFFCDREIWIEVSDEKLLVAHAYHKDDDYPLTLRISEDKTETDKYAG